MSTHPMEPREDNLHRNNAAEWVMVAALYPIRIAYRVMVALRRRFTRDP